jgi:hypothetical protein
MFKVTGFAGGRRRDEAKNIVPRNLRDLLFRAVLRDAGKNASATKAALTRRASMNIAKPPLRNNSRNRGRYSRL